MKKTLFAFIPSGFALLYAIAQLIAYMVMGRMYFSSLFLWELIIYVLLGLLYIFIVFRVDRSAYLRTAVYGLILGVVVFVILGTVLFLNFEFSQNLSI